MGKRSLLPLSKKKKNDRDRFTNAGSTRVTYTEVKKHKGIEEIPFFPSRLKRYKVQKCKAWWPLTIQWMYAQNTSKNNPYWENQDAPRQYGRRLAMNCYQIGNIVHMELHLILLHYYYSPERWLHWHWASNSLLLYISSFLKVLNFQFTARYVYYMYLYIYTTTGASIMQNNETFFSIHWSY